MDTKPDTIELNSIHLVEASAGTGKTYTITSLYLRLLVEKKLRPDQILVLTFTEAAVKELHERIRTRLRQALEMFDGKQVKGDDFLAGFVDSHRHDSVARMILVHAERSFDLAAIYTIHGFCQRVLQECAFESGTLFELKTVRDDKETVNHLVDDYWRIHSPLWPDTFNNYLQSPGSHGLHADLLFEQIGKVIHPTRIHGMSALLSASASPYDFNNLERDMAHLADQWKKERWDILQLIADAGLSKAKTAYKPENVESWAMMLDIYFADSQTPMPVAALHQFSSSKLAGSLLKKGVAPEHAFFNRMEDVFSGLAAYRQYIWNEALRFCQEKLTVRKWQDGICTFDDLLIAVRDGLRQDGQGVKLAAYLQKKYPTALIDEFQDTDSVQFEIFESIYQQGDIGNLFLVGDPKQAIYKFRGADIFTYMKAAADVSLRHCLKDNYRSCPGLVEAVNILFGLHDNPFFFRDISYQPVNAAVKESQLVFEDTNKPLTIWHFNAPQKPMAKNSVARSVANEICRLICAGQDGEALLGENPLRAGDIAVLVRSHSDGEIVKQALLERGIVSVSTSRKSVYETVDAWELQLLLEAVENSGATRQLKAALASSLMGWNMADLQDFESDGYILDELRERFRRYRFDWEKHGFAAMLQGMIRGEQIDARLARYEDGERRITNIRHLMELLQEHSGQLMVGPAELISWLKKKRHRVNNNPHEEEELRLESDEHLVRIVTIHKSKGLEFPVVFCPFLWDSRFKAKPDSPFVFFHDSDSLYRIDYQTIMRQKHHEIQLREEMAEELRLLYVALTRARERCYIAIGNVESRRPLAGSALGYLLYPAEKGDEFSLDARKKFFKSMSTESFMKPLLELAETGKVHVASLPEDTTLTTLLQDEQSICAPRLSSRILRVDRIIRSFSSMQDYVFHAIEEPDHDGLVRYDDVLDESSHLGLLGFPLGKQAGSCLHLILENIDFNEPDSSRITYVVKEELLRFGFSEEYALPLGRDIYRLLDVEMQVGLKLADISLVQRLDELEFFYTVPDLSREGIKNIFNKYMGKKDIVKRSGAPRVGELGQGYMKGYIDLIFEWQGKFYIVDYKSNFLGDGMRDYQQEKLSATMGEVGYDLQYYIYIVALHRYLMSRLPAYDYDIHFGGVYYLFLRGMNVSATGSGIFYDRPGKEVIEALDRELRIEN